jgi:outer membrane receptor protein involved in Fe transport
MPHGHLLTAGADYERESGSIGDPQSLTEAVRNNFGFFAQDQWALRDRLFAAAGVRLENNDSFGFFAAPRISLAFHVHQPSPGSAVGLTKIKGNFGLGIKEPTLVESYSQSPFFRGNPDLKPEKSVSFDAGIEQHFGEGRSLLELTYFDNRFRDQVGFVTTDFTTFEGSFFNIGKTRARGVEGALLLYLSPRWEAGGAYTFLNSRVLESTSFDPVFAPGQELFRRPRHSGYVDLRWKPGSWTFGATAILVGRRVDSDFSGLGLNRNPGYGILNLMVNYRLSDSISWFVLVNNALDKEYMEALGFPALRAHFRIGLRAGF